MVIRVLIENLSLTIAASITEANRIVVDLVMTALAPVFRPFIGKFMNVSAVASYYTRSERTQFPNFI